MNSKEHFHGSDLEKIEAIYKIKKENITSFSANVNPLGISPLLREQLSNKIDIISKYPDREYTMLRQSIAHYASCDSNNVIVGNGSTELISLFIKIISPKKALILGPTYSEYEREISLSKGTSLYYPLDEERDFKLDINDFINRLSPDIDILVICNPNNPTSTNITCQQMRQILDACKCLGIFAIIDETYVEFTDNISEISSVSLTAYYNNLVVLRGVSKFFAAPGLRLGYAICSNNDLLTEINQKQNPWAINSLAEVAGTIMFNDIDYINKTRSLIISERNRLYDIFDNCKGIKAYRPSANFMLLKITKEGITSHDIFELAIKRGLLIRDCSTFPFLDNHYIRFCFMSPEKNNELTDCILNALNGTISL